MKSAPSIHVLLWSTAMSGKKSLSVSCEEVGRIIFSDEGKMSYEDIELPDFGIEDEFYEDEEEEPFEEDMEEFCSHLEEYRTQAVAILQNREKSIDDRIREYLKFCEKLQNVVENPEEELWEPIEYFHVRMETFDELENVNEEWMEVKQRVRDFFETHSYTEALEEYKKSGDYNEIWYEHILVYFTYRYFMRAWYDGNVLAKAQFAIVGFLVIRDMDIVRYFANGKSFKLDDRIANARIFSREVEHSEETLEILEDDISFDEAFLTFTLPQSGQRFTSLLAMKVYRQASQVKKLSAKSSNLINLYSVKASLMKDNNCST